MYRVIVGIEDLYYERVDEWELMVFEKYEDAQKFGSLYALDATDAYIKVIDDDNVIRGYKKNETKGQIKRMIGFA